MTTNSRTSRRLAAGSLAAAAVAVLAAANPAAGASHSADDAVCSFDQASLPRTADAMQGWYDQCWSQQPFSTTKAGLPAGDDWYVQRKTGHVFVRVSYETTTPTANRPADWRALMNQVPETTQTPTATRPADWRALMNEVPESPQLLGRSQLQTQTVAAFDNGVGPGQNLYDVVSG
jgi:hypothetical protein